MLDSWLVAVEAPSHVHNQILKWSVITAIKSIYDCHAGRGGPSEAAGKLRKVERSTFGAQRDEEAG